MLLTTEDMTILSGVKVAFRNRIRRAAAMDYPSCDHGGMLEFHDYQQFTPGENVRHIDWNRYMRDQSLVSRRYEQLERPEVTVVPDLSRSVAAAGKTDSVRRLTAAICFCLLNKGVNVKLYAKDWTPYSGKAGCQRICRAIQSLPENRDCHLSIQSGVSRFSRDVVVVSDLIFSDGFQQFQKQMNMPQRSALLVNLSSKQDRDPDWKGNFRLLDAQTDRPLPCYVDSGMIRRYQQCRTDYYRQVEAFCLQRQWRYLEIFAEDNLYRQFEAIAPNGTLYV